MAAAHRRRRSRADTALVVVALALLVGLVLLAVAVIAGAEHRAPRATQAVPASVGGAVAGLP